MNFCPFLEFTLGVGPLKSGHRFTGKIPNLARLYFAKNNYLRSGYMRMTDAL